MKINLRSGAKKSDHHTRGPGHIFVSQRGVQDARRRSEELQHKRTPRVAGGYSESDDHWESGSSREPGKNIL